MISKLQYKTALWFPFDRRTKRKKKRYGKKLNYQDLPARYLMKISTEKGVKRKYIN